MELAYRNELALLVLPSFLNASIDRCAQTPKMASENRVAVLESRLADAEARIAALESRLAEKPFLWSQPKDVERLVQENIDARLVELEHRIPNLEPRGVRARRSTDYDPFSPNRFRPTNASTSSGCDFGGHGPRFSFASDPERPTFSFGSVDSERPTFSFGYGPSGTGNSTTFSFSLQNPAANDGAASSGFSFGNPNFAD